MKHTRYRAYMILLVFAIIVVLFHVFGYTGHFGFDDLHYAELASDLIHGKVHFEDHYAYRLPVVLFTALFYMIFGVSDLASSLPAILATLSILLIVFYIQRDESILVIVISLSLITFSNWFLFYSDKLMPDIYVALSVVSALAVIHHYKYKGDQSRTLLHAFLLAFSLFFGLMAKGTIVLTLPLLLYLAITDIILKREVKFWIYGLISGTAMLVIYLLVIWIFTGDVMKRLHAISSNSYLNLCSYDRQSLGVLFRRIFLGFFELSLYQSLATGFVFIVAAVMQRGSVRHFRLNDPFSFFLVSALILFLSSSFMTISFKSYSPMCLDPRHYLFLVPAASVPASKIIAAFIRTRQYGIRIAVMLLLVTVISFFIPGDTFWKLYLPLLVLFSVYLLAGENKLLRIPFLILFTAILILIPADMIRYAGKVKYRKQRDIVVEQVLENNTDGIIITNEVQKRLLRYYSGFSIAQDQRLTSFDRFSSYSSTGERKLMLLNPYTRYLSDMTENDLPYYAVNISPENRLIYQSRDPDITLYEMREFSRFDQAENRILSTFNDFELKVPYWDQDDHDLSTDISYSGSYSNKVARFSSTFDFPMDSIQMKGSQGIVVQGSFYCFAEGRTGSRIVISIENSTGVYFWKAIEINRYIQAYSNWWPIHFQVNIGQQEFRVDSRLKVYLLRSDQQQVYIDDFEINLWPTDH
jgi:hypothetical protein